MAFFRIAGGVLRGTGGPGLPVHAVLLDAFEEALLLRWCGEY